MPYHDVQPPDLLPILSPGKHRNPRTGACFMELASLLAGERWSDHPTCTHPLLAAVARHVNDHTSDAGRQRLTHLVPSVIGLTGDELHIDARIALRSATMALPVVAADRQRVMAVSVLTCDRVLAELDGRAAGALEEQSRRALADVPQAAGWADRFTSGVRPSAKRFRRQAAPTTVQDAVQGIAQSCVPNPDGMLRDLLVQAIDACAAWVGRPDRGGVIDHTLWVRRRCCIRATQGMLERRPPPGIRWSRPVRPLDGRVADRDLGPLVPRSFIRLCSPVGSPPTPTPQGALPWPGKN
jgi:hypothetical protein